MMRTLLLLLLVSLSCSTGAVFNDTSTFPAKTVLTVEHGDEAVLPCYTAGNVTPSVTTWAKDGREVDHFPATFYPPMPARGSDDFAPSPRLVMRQDGDLHIKPVLRGDEGTYHCTSLLPGGGTIYHARVLLQVTSGPENVSLSISPATALSNGTRIAIRGSAVSFNCSGSTYPYQQLTWAFEGASSTDDSLLSSYGPWLNYRIENIQPSGQGVYSCRAHNNISHQTLSKNTEVLVYYAPDRHPECMWTPAQDPSHIHFNCTWLGAYPTPTLRWGDEYDNLDGERVVHIYSTEVTESLSVTLNRSQLRDGQTLACVGQHLALTPGQEKSCSFTLRPPFPEGDPIATALEAGSVTLTCTEVTSMPPANTTWRKGMPQEIIVSGSKYVVTEDGPVLKLTILNVSKDDEGTYFCRSENPLNVTELEVYLTVKTSSTFTGVIIGIFIAALIVGSTVIIAKAIYSNRHRICLGGGFGQMEDTGDVMDLVESDDEQFFQDAVPRLPPLTNGHHTTLVQIHRIPSSDYSDAAGGDTSPRPHDVTAHREEPVELVTL